METIRSFLRSNSFRNSFIRNDLNTRNSSILSNADNSNQTPMIENETSNEVLIEGTSSNDKLSRDNIKSFLSRHPSSSSLSSRSPCISSQPETCSGSSIPLSNHTNIVASASASIANARSFTSHHHSNEHQTNRQQRRHSWTGEHNHHHHIPSSMRRTKSHHYQDRIQKPSKVHKYPTEKLRRKIIQVNRASNSQSLPLSTNINNQSVPVTSTPIRLVKTTATNAFLTAASIVKYWVEFCFTIRY